MSTTHKEPNYMMVFFALFVLTVAEVGVVYVPLSKLVIAVILIVLALVKAALVALYFMHLRYEKFALGVIAFTPLILCTLLIVSLLPDLTSEHKSANIEAQQATEQMANIESAAPGDGN